MTLEGLRGIIQSIEPSASEDAIQIIFSEILLEVKAYLDMEEVDKNIRLILTKQKSQPLTTSSKELRFFNFGVQREFDPSIEIQLIELDEQHEKFFPFILLREAYLCFIPAQLKENINVNAFINQKVMIDLNYVPTIDEWKELTRQALGDPQYLDPRVQFDRLESFLAQESSGEIESPFQFFISFIRNNIQIVSDSPIGFYDMIYISYKTKASFYLTGDRVETLWAIFQIFKRVKRYRAILDYQHYFEEFKEKGQLEAYLSKRKFLENMKFIKDYTDVAPNYHLNWRAINTYVISAFITFNPILSRKKVKALLQEVPFIIWLSQEYRSFATEFHGFFILPQSYYHDLLEFLQKLEKAGYLIKKRLINYDNSQQFFNLNYLLNFYDRKTLINLNHPDFNPKYILSLNINYGTELYTGPTTIFDWVLFERIKWVKVTGLGFESRSEQIRTLREDMSNLRLNQENMIKKIEQLQNLGADSSFKSFAQHYIHKIRRNGFFYVKMLVERIIIIKRAFESSIREDSTIQTLSQIKENGLSHSIDTNLIMKDNVLEQILLQDFFPFYFSDKTKYDTIAKNYESLHSVLQLCLHLKQYTADEIINLIQNPLYIKEKEELVLSEHYKEEQITQNLIEDKIDFYLDHNLIYPLMITSINPKIFVDRIEIVARRGPQLENLIEELSRICITCGTLNNDKYSHFRLVLPLLTSFEMQEMISVIHMKLQSDLIFCRKVNSSYILASAHSPVRGFYDFTSQDYIHSPYLFNECFHSFQSSFKTQFTPLKENELFSFQRLIWPSVYNSFEEVIATSITMASRENVDLSSSKLEELKKFHLNVCHLLKDQDAWNLCKNTFTYTNYVDSVKFIPTFERFGLGKYFLYFFPTELEELDFKLLLANSFQKVRCSADIDIVNSFLISYIFPNGNPNMTWFNWLTKAKRVIREYCLFKVKKTFHLMQFHRNLSSKEWDMNYERFVQHYQKVLFDPSYSIQPEYNEYMINDKPESALIDPHASEYQDLIQIYNWRSLDIKSILGTKKVRTAERILRLLEKKLIYPYIRVKNLDLREKIYIILPNTSKGLKEKILAIFSFFNLCYISEIEGEYYIHGFKNEIRFSEGFYIKIYLPSSNTRPLGDYLEKLFQYLGISHYLILFDMINGNQLLKAIYGGMEFLKTYNPLRNFKWNTHDKIWMNPKLLTEKFEKIYPDLVPKN